MCSLCPRYYGRACGHVAHASIEVTWTGPRTLNVHMDRPRLTWNLSVTRSTVLALLNAASALMPLASWRPRGLVRGRELLAGALGMGRLEMAGETPSGHQGLLMPQRMYLVDRSEANMDGALLGQPTRLKQNPTIGGVSLPARGVLAIGAAVWAVRDPEEYERLRNETSHETARKETAS